MIQCATLRTGGLYSTYLLLQGTPQLRKHPVYRLAPMPNSESDSVKMTRDKKSIKTIPGIKICDRGSLSLLGSPIFDQGFKNTVEKTIITVENLLNKAVFLSRHVAYTLIKNCLFIPKFNFLLRTTPFWKFSNYVNSIDSSLKSSLEKILNLRLTDLQWCQSTLPIRFGGLGIRRISDICLPAFLSSVHGVKKLVSQLLNSKDNELIIHHYDEALAVWDVENENERPTIPQFQKNWDNINIKRIIDNDLIFNSSRDLARFKALQCRESGSWLHAIPSPNIGTLLDNTSFQVCIGLRLGCNLCTPHICKCNAKVDEIGIHGLSCSKSSGRFSRHTEINSIINRSLTSCWSGLSNLVYDAASNIPVDNHPRCRYVGGLFHNSGKVPPSGSVTSCKRPPAYYP
jgi:hypothetical protein